MTEIFILHVDQRSNWKNNRQQWKESIHGVADTVAYPGYFDEG